MKRIFSALAVALATLLVIGGDAVVNFGGAAASMTDAAPAVPLTVASVSALPTGTTEPSPETALFSGLLGAAALTAHPGGETAEDALLNNEDAAKAAAAQAAEEEPPQETPEADEAPVSTAVQALGVISGTGVRMRSGAGTGYDILKTLDKGAVIELTAQEGDWYRISFDGKRGYVAAQYVTRYDTASGLNGAGRVTADVLNIRTAAKSGSTSLGTVSQGTVIAVTGIESGGWFAVTYNGISGYVASQYVLICPTSALTGTADKPAENTTTEGSPAEAPAETPATPAASASGSSIVSIAQQYLGVPYVYGGSSASGFDCSGFTMYVFAQVGIKLPHGATSQLSYGTEVSRSDLQARRSGILPGLRLHRLSCGHLYRRRPVHPRLVLLLQRALRGDHLPVRDVLQQPLPHRAAALMQTKHPRLQPWVFFFTAPPVPKAGCIWCSAMDLYTAPKPHRVTPRCRPRFRPLPPSAPRRYSHTAPPACGGAA